MSVLKPCTCGDFGKNMRVSDCAPSLAPGLRIGVMALVAEDGTENSLDPAQMSDPQYLIDRMNETDKSKRLFMSPIFTSATPALSDRNTQELQNRSVKTLNKGIRSWTFLFQDEQRANPALAFQINNMACGSFGVFIWDYAGQIGARNKGDGLAYPMPVDSGSWNADHYFPVDGESVAYVQLDFNYSRIVTDADFGVISPDAIANDVEDLNGLFDVCVTVSNRTPTTFDAKLELIYGYIEEPQPVKGFDVADIALYNVTDDVDANPTVFSESATEDGLYTCTHDDATGDILRLTLGKEGFEKVITLINP